MESSKKHPRFYSPSQRRPTSAGFAALHAQIEEKNRQIDRFHYLLACAYDLVAEAQGKVSQNIPTIDEERL